MLFLWSYLGVVQRCRWHFETVYPLQAIWVAGMTPGQGLALEQMEWAVEEARMRYIKAYDARYPCTALWNEYARLLHALRLRQREIENEG